jgi:hypothetical protein
MSQEMLYINLARAATGSSQGVMEDLERGKGIFDRLLPAIRSEVCDSAALKSFLAKGDVYAAISLISELLAGYIKIPKATASVAVLSARLGLSRLCPQ